MIPVRIQSWLIAWNMILLVAILTVVFAKANPVQATASQTDITPLPATGPVGASLIEADSIASVRYEEALGRQGIITVVPVTDQPFKNAIRIAVDQPRKNPWDIQIRWLNTEPIVAKDTVLVSFKARQISVRSETGTGLVELQFQQSASPWQSYVAFVASVGPQWTQIDVPFKVWQAASAGAMQATLNFASQEQVIEVADVKVRHYGPEVKLADLPRTRTTYSGRADDASWRQEAQKRIEQYRKGDLVIEVLDDKGKGVADATIELRQIRSTFLVGTAVRNWWINGSSPDHDRYREIFLKYFNCAVFENEMKWPEWQAGGDAANAQKHHSYTSQAVDWLLEQGLYVRGHTLVWPGWGKRYNYLPTNLNPLVAAGDKAAVRQRTDSHIRDIVGYFKGRVAEWDVVNEPVDQNDLLKFLGREAMVDWFRAARDADPTALLVLNDYCMLSGGATSTGRIDAFYDNVKFLIDQGAPIDAIGEQAHFDATLVGIERMIQLLDRFGSLGVRIRLTEFDINVDDEQLQADYTRDFLTAAFSHPSVDAVVMWGFWEKSHWRPRAALWRTDWSAKPNAHVLDELVSKSWRTNLTVQTNPVGLVETRGFMGDYEIVITRNGRTTTAQATIGRAPSTIRVVLN